MLILPCAVIDEAPTIITSKMLVNHLLSGSILEHPVRNQNSKMKQGIEAWTDDKLTSCKEGLNAFF